MAQKREKQGTGDSRWRTAAWLATALLFALATAAAGLYAHYRTVIARPLLAEGASEVTVVIPKNTAWPGVVERLGAAGVVERPLYFQLWARRRGLPPEVRAGTYHFAGPLSREQLAASLRRGGSVQEIEVTIPEGFTIFDIADRLAEQRVVGRDEFLRAARDERALEEAGLEEAESFEGYLFPDTYRFRQGTDAPAIVARMHARFEKIWTELGAKRAASLARVREAFELDRHDLVTLASLVEREAIVDAERPRIGRVFLNRLERGMRLQTDPSCVYGPETYREVPSPKRCHDRLNRYSTYVIDGLPPGPIANPGRASLAAVMAPEEGAEAREWLYFVARQDGSGRHHFSRTYREHRRAIRRYLK